MKTCFEFFLDEVQRRLDSGSISPERAEEWIGQFKDLAAEHEKVAPNDPFVQMPKGN